MIALLIVVFCINHSTAKAGDWKGTYKTVPITGGSMKVKMATDCLECWVQKITPNKKASKIVVPEKVGAYTVTKLEGYNSENEYNPYNVFGTSFNEDDCEIKPNNKNIKEIVLPDTIDDIGNFAFAGLTKFEKIHLPKNLLEICDRIFMDCDSLKSITIPKKVLKINFSAFGFDSDKVSIHIEKGNEEYVEKAGCILSKDKKKMYFRSKFSKTLTIPKTVSDITGDIFWSPQKNATIKKITLEKGNKKLAIKNNCIYTKKDKRLVCVIPDKKGTVRIPKEVKILGENVSSTSKLKKLYIPKTVTTWYYNWDRYLRNTSYRKYVFYVEGNKMPKTDGYKNVFQTYQYYAMNKELAVKLRKYVKKYYGSSELKYDGDKKAYYIF